MTAAENFLKCLSLAERHAKRHVARLRRVAGEDEIAKAGKTGLNPVAFVTKVVEGIPKNEAGKTLYAELEKLV